MTPAVRGLAAAIAGLSLFAAASIAGAKPASPVRALDPDHLLGERFEGDFDAMLQRRLIRVLAPVSRSLFFTDKGHERGLTAAMARDFETWLNRRYHKRLKRRPLTVVIVPTTRDELLDGIVQGRGDIAAGNLTITPRRLEQVDFVALDRRATGRELLVTGPATPPTASLDDLAGRKVHVRPASSFHDSLSALSLRLQLEGRAPLEMSPLPDALEDEDKLEMLAAGLLQYVVVDEWKGRMWVKALPKLVLREDLVLRDDAQVGWAIRKHSPQLEAELTAFADEVLQRQAVLAQRRAQAVRAQRLRNPNGDAEWRRFEHTVALFRTYGHQYGFDPLMLVAQGFQESRLRQDARSPVGAIGIMQLMPATGAEMNVGDIRVAAANIHAGAKYMSILIRDYFKDAQFDEQDRTLFAFASYNAGPGRIASMRRLAEKRGLDPNRWFNHVELVTAEKVGMETTLYVRNIFKYYVSYSLALEAVEERRAAREKWGDER